MRSRTLGLLAVVSMLATANADAVMLRLDATTQFPEQTNSFAIQFEDTGDGLFDLDELTSFTGITINGESMTRIFAAPTIAGISNPTPPCTDKAWWCFGRVTALLIVEPSAWTYAITPVRGTVPEPGTLALLGLGLTGLALSRRRKA